MATNSGVLGAEDATLGDFVLAGTGAAADTPPGRQRHRHRPKPKTFDRPIYLGLQDRRRE